MNTKPVKLNRFHPALSGFLPALAAAVLLAEAAGAQTATWSGAALDQNWATAGNWTPAAGGSAPPAATDTVIFGNGPFPAATNTAGLVDNIVTANTTIGALTYNNQSSTLNYFHTTQINTGVTLTVNGLFSLGLAGQTCTDTMTGTGNFTVNNITGNFSVAGGGISTATCTLTLADGTNTINVKTLSMSESGGNNGRASTLNLGAGPTIINADNVNMGTGKGQVTTIKWLNPAATNSITIRDHTGTGRATFLMGNGASASGSPSAQLLLAGHHADILAGTMTMGESSGSSTATSKSNMTLDNGILDATAIIMGEINIGEELGGTTAAQVNPAILTIGGNPTNTATLIVNSPGGPGGGVFLLADSYTNHTANCTLNLGQNANAQVYCSIVKAQSAYPASDIAAVNITNATLNMEAATNTVGLPTYPIDTVSLNGASLYFYENGSALNLAAGSLALSGTNRFFIQQLPVISSLSTVIPLITFTSYSTDGNASNLVLGASLPGGYGGYITNDGVGAISLVINSGTIVAKADLWGGGVNNKWDITSLNWTKAGVVVKYGEGDFVTFDDSGKTNNVNLSAAHSPASLTVTDNSLNYTFSGVGAISGASSLVKNGGATLTLAESGGDNFAGGIYVHGGTLVLDDPNSNLSGGLTNDANTVVQIGNNDANGTLPGGALLDNGVIVFLQNANKSISAVIAGAGSLTQSGNNTLILDAAETYTGNTVVNAGTLALGASGSVASGLVTVGNATLDVTSANTVAFGALTVSNGTFKVGSGVNSPSATSLSVSNSTIVLSEDYNNMGGLSVFTASSLITGGATNIIAITTLQNLPLSPSLPFSLHLIGYSSATFNSGFNFGWNGLPGITGYITNNAVNNSIDLVVIGAPVNLGWNGGSATGSYWSDAANWSGTSIVPLDALVFDGSTRLNNTNDTAAGTAYQGVTFNSTAGQFSLNGKAITLDGTIVNNSAGVETVNLGLDISAGCALDGGSGGGSLAINSGVANTTTGHVVVTNFNVGTINDLWQSTNGGQLELQVAGNGGDWTVLDGTGSGALVNAGDVQLHVNPSGVGQISFGSSNSAPNVDLGFTNGGAVQIDGSSAGTFNMNNGTLRANSMAAGGNGLQNSLFNMNGGTLVLGAGSFAAGSGSGGSTLTVTITNGSIFSTNGGNFTLAQRSVATINQSGGLLQCGTFVPATGQTIGGNGVYNLGGGVFICTNISVGSSGNNAWGTINYNGGTLKPGASSAALFKQNNLAIITNSVQVGGLTFDSGGFSTAFNLPLVSDPTTDPNQGGTPPDGGLTKLGAGTLTLSSLNTYNGITAVGGGTLLVSGSIPNTSGVTVSNNATLGGGGIIGSNVIIQAGGTLTPGNNAVGTLTVGGNITLGGTNIMKIDKVGATYDVLLATNAAATTITYGGTLQVSVLTGSITATDTFKLYSATNYAGAFAAISPATPGTGLGWNTNTLTTDGTLRVITTVNTNPTNITAHVSGSQLTLAWPADHTGWRLQVQTNSPGSGLGANWSAVPGSSSVNSVIVTISPTNGAVFYRMVYP